MLSSRCRSQTVHVGAHRTRDLLGDSSGSATHRITGQSPSDTSIRRRHKHRAGDANADRNSFAHSDPNRVSDRIANGLTDGYCFAYGYCFADGISHGIADSLTDGDADACG